MNIFILNESVDTGFGPRANRVHSVFFTEAQAREAMQTLVDEYLNHLCTEIERVPVGDWVYLRAVDGPHAGEDLLSLRKGSVSFCRCLTVWREADEETYPGDDVRGYSIEECEVRTAPVRSHERSEVR